MTPDNLCLHALPLTSCPTCISNPYEEMERLCAEIVRLKRGDFTPTEWQELCHHRDTAPEGCTQAAFEAGCQEYQRKLFGTCEADRLRAERIGYAAEVGRLTAIVTTVTAERDALAAMNLRLKADVAGALAGWEAAKAERNALWHANAAIVADRDRLREELEASLAAAEKLAAELEDARSLECESMRKYGRCQG